MDSVIAQLDEEILSLDPRSIATAQKPVFVINESQNFTFLILALSGASISLCAGLFTFYWFLQMRRRFRHHLIMLLITSDMLKSLCFLIFPIAVLTRGSIISLSPICHVSGFILQYFVVASDVAILFITLHTALYIFLPDVSKQREGGLYHYRHIAYPFWIIWPALEASLAFLNTTNPYVNSGPSCGLPVRPFWARLALNWVPRYVVVLTIIGIYVAINVSVHRKFKGVRIQHDANIDEDAEETEQSRQPEKPSPIAWEAGGTDTTMDLPKMQSSMPVWENYVIDGSRTLGISSRSLTAVPTLASLARNELSIPQLSATPVADKLQTRPTRPNLRRALTIPTNVGCEQEPIQELQSKRGPALDSHFRTTSTAVSMADPTAMARKSSESALTRRHRLIQRKLYHLFIYPMAYICMWAVPFVNHCFQYSDSYTANPNMVLGYCVTMIISLQCAIDCALFCLREKPWTHRITNDPGSWGLIKSSIGGQNRGQIREATSPELQALRHQESSLGKGLWFLLGRSRYFQRHIPSDTRISDQAKSEKRKLSVFRFKIKDKHWFDQDEEGHTAKARDPAS